MPFYVYILIAYLVIINIISGVVYAIEGNQPSSLLSAAALIILPIVGGSFGACVCNYVCDTEYRELRASLQKILAYLPPIMFFCHLILIIYIFGFGNIVSFVWNYSIEKAGWIGGYLWIINILGFILVIIRKSSNYFAPWWTSLIPDLVLIPVLILGGATGGVIAKVLFNFKEDWSCDCTKVFQNFIYNAGMFVFSFAHIVAYVYFFVIK